MSLTVKEKGGTFKPVPAGTHFARCVSVIDLGTQPGSERYPDSKPKVLLGWEIPSEPIQVDGKSMPSRVSSRYTASLNQKATLRQLLEAWRGRTFTAEELAGFSLKAILGQPCMLTIVHSSDGQYANVRTASKMPKGVEAAPAAHALVYYQIEDGENDVFRSLSEKLRATINGCEERRIERGEYVPTPSGDSEHEETGSDNDDIPF